MKGKSLFLDEKSIGSHKSCFYIDILLRKIQQQKDKVNRTFRTIIDYAGNLNIWNRAEYNRIFIPMYNYMEYTKCLY